MAVIRIEKTKDYTVMSNYHFREREMSLKAKGLLSFMLSLPDDWDYSIAGLETMLKESRRMCDTIGDCEECPLNGLAAVIPCRLVGANLESANPEKAVEVIETWAKANPKKTRQSEF